VQAHTLDEVGILGIG